MKSLSSGKFDDQYFALPETIRKKVDKQIQHLLQNLRHPSLRAKKYGGTNDVWQARIDRKYRFYFKIEGDTYLLLTITMHKD